jgi:hypothetical protein
MADVLSCGPEAALSHCSGAALLGLRAPTGRSEVSEPADVTRRPRGIIVHRRTAFSQNDVTVHAGIPVTTPVCTLIDLAARIGQGRLEAAINQADKLDLVDPEELRAALDDLTRRPGLGLLRKTLDRPTFTLTDSELERLFLPIARRAGLPKPQTGVRLNGFDVDFYWPDLGLVVEPMDCVTTAPPPSRLGTASAIRPTPSRATHRSRFTRAQVRFERGHVQAALSALARRLGSR